MKTGLIIPHTPYYGTADATPLYLITLHSAWMSTGDLSLLRKHLDTAERCLAWIDKFGDRDGDGFQEYETRSPVGYAKQGWKDSGDAVMNLDGQQPVSSKYKPTNPFLRIVPFSGRRKQLLIFELLTICKQGSSSPKIRRSRIPSVKCRILR